MDARKRSVVYLFLLLCIAPKALAASTYGTTDDRIEVEHTGPVGGFDDVELFIIQGDSTSSERSVRSSELKSSFIMNVYGDNNDDSTWAAIRGSSAPFACLDTRTLTSSSIRLTADCNIPGYKEWRDCSSGEVDEYENPICNYLYEEVTIIFKCSTIANLNQHTDSTGTTKDRIIDYYTGKPPAISSSSRVYTITIDGYVAISECTIKVTNESGTLFNFNVPNALITKRVKKFRIL